MGTETAQSAHTAAFAIEETVLRRDLGLKESTAIVIGNVIGSGIFITPGIVAGALHSSGEILLIWLVCGVVTLFGALSLAELGALMPQTGGRYIYFREAFGPPVGFLFAWVTFLITTPGNIAALAVGFAGYVSFFITLSPAMVKGVAIACLVFLSAVNYVGVRHGGAVQTVFTILKLSALGLLILLGLFGRHGTAAHLTPWWSITSPLGLIAVFGAVMSPVLFTFDGWTDITNVAGEIKNPRRALPLSLVLGVSLILVLYVVANLAYIYVVPIGEIAGTPRIASIVSERLFGPIGASIISVIVLVSIFGATNGLILSGPRHNYAIAADPLMGSHSRTTYRGPLRVLLDGFHAFFRWMTRIHPRYQTPATAIVFQGLCSAAVVFIGSGFEQIVTYLTFTQWLFYALGALAVFIMRVRYPDAERPYRAWGYPLTPAIFLLVAIGFLLTTIVYHSSEALAGLVIVATGLPAYWFWTRCGD